MLPSREIAIKIIEDAHKVNEGKWREHSYNVAKSAEIIAKKSKLSSEKAYILGLLHDIGRKFGISHIKHVLDGFNYMESLGYDEVSRICLTHSFPIKEIFSYNGKIDISKDEVEYLKNKINSIEYDDYDRLIQLCDAISMAEGFVILEKRLFDVAIRNGINEFTVEKWKKFIEIKEIFDKKCNMDVYKLLGI